jgi:hypothetical protein
MAKAKSKKAPASSGKPGDVVSVSCEAGVQKGILLPSSNPYAIAIKLP